jgi:hypothetical protein
MTDLEIKNYKFPSGLTYNEADLVVDRYVDSLMAKHKDDLDFVIHMMKSHMSRAVREYKMEREIVGACTE